MRVHCGFVLVLSLMFAGCSSRKPPPPVPVAMNVAQRTAAQATKLSESQNWGAAAREWQLAADRYAALNDRAGEAVALHNLAQVRKELGALDEAHKILEQAAKLNEDPAHANEWWRNQIALLQVEALSKQTEALKSRFEKLTPMAARLADSSLRGLFLNELGLWQQSEGDLEKASETFRQAEQNFRAARDELGMATVLANQARLAQQRQNYSEAIIAWRAALTKFEKLGDVRGIARALAGEGRARLSEKDLPAAEALLRRASRNYRTMRAKEELESTLNALVECLVAQDKKSEAESVRAELVALQKSSSKVD